MRCSEDATEPHVCTSAALVNVSETQLASTAIQDLRAPSPYLLADRAWMKSGHIGVDNLRLLCNHGSHVLGYESQLAQD